MRNPSAVPVPAAPDARETQAERTNSTAGEPADSPAEAQGRRILSTAFVRLGAGEVLMVELHDGHVIVLRDVVMGRKNYCGVQVEGDGAGGRYCGDYASIAAVRTGARQGPQDP